MAKIQNPQDQNGIGLINQIVLDAAIKSEETRAIAEEMRLDAAIVAETSRATVEEAQIRTDLTNRIETETNVRIDADSKLSNRIDEISGNVKISYLDSIPENTVNWCAISVIESHGSEILSGKLVKAIEFKVSNTPSSDCRLGVYNSGENTAKKCLAVSRAISITNDRAIFEFETPFAFVQTLELYILEGGDNFPGNGEPPKPSTYIESPAENDGEGSTWKNYDKTSQFWNNPKMAFYIVYHVIGQIEKVEKNLNTKIDNLSIINEEVKTKISPIYKSFEQKFKSDSSNSLNCRGFGNIINKTGFLKSVTTYCPADSNTTESVYLKVFEKTSAPHIFKGISDALLAHGSNNVLNFTFNESKIELERGKEYFFVFTNESQKASTEFSNSNTDSCDCCIKVASNSNPSSGVLGSNDYSRRDRQAIYIIEQEEPVTISIENKIESLTELYSNVEESESLNFYKDNCNAAGIQFFAPKSGYLNQLNIGCRNNNNIPSSSEQYAKIWDITAGYGANAVLKGISTNTQHHSVNPDEVFDLKYAFNNVELIKGNKYAIITTEESYKNNTSIIEGLQSNCYCTFSQKNEGIFKAAFINDEATGENNLSHSPIMSMTIISESTKKMIDNAISNALNQSSYKFTRNKNIEMTFGEEDETLEDTVILTLTEEGKIITANAVSNNLSIIQEISEDMKSISLRVSATKPSESVSTHIIVDSICDSEAYDNAQHVCHVIPVLIN